MEKELQYTRIEHIKPEDIEKRSFEIISQELQKDIADEQQAKIIKRCIHTSADFDYADNLCFSDNAVPIFLEAIKKGACIVADTQMVKAGINKKKLAEFGGEVYCFMSDEDVADEARRSGKTRASVSMEKACSIKQEIIFAVGNAPTALIRLDALIKEHKIKPAGIIAVPVGFVNVVQSKEIIIQGDIPYIAARGRKGGSNIAACICNALLYML